ncbi:MnhB domain-containing protein [Pseudonocardia asaccharolytica]|uniref:Cation:proton antiporter n=1 Tax=Pseudonocardia asaccharolytica DSM 44247 = NBRC 16224 TaxID=1123024 RepID=A0A511D2R7_9PSEU|nr:MnhB domain-containing protein [Pseudonocardia asaccharolytica]GEL19085.1 cation:proton antiporter [Pseudonocardia asaccharolytica DSM 44247 = NBRC 16224]
MSRPARLVLFLVAAAGVAALLVVAFLDLPPFGSPFHPYRDRAVAAAVAHATANVVGSVTFDQRGLDTLVEETILLGSVAGAAALLRPSKEERENTTVPEGGRVLEATKLTGYLLLPVTLLVGIDVVVHGHLTPGGGFQGGVLLGTAVHLLYLTGHYRALDRVRPLPVFDSGEALGAAAFAALGIAGIIAAGAFLGNILPFGTFGELLSAGTVPVFNIAVGVEVASGVIVLLAKFLEQALRVQREAVS